MSVINEDNKFDIAFDFFRKLLDQVGIDEFNEITAEIEHRIGDRSVSALEWFGTAADIYFERHPDGPNPWMKYGSDIL